MKPSRAAIAKRNPVSDADVEYFDAMVRKWQLLLNLRDWRIINTGLRHPTMMAQVDSYEFEHKLAKYRVGEYFGATPVTPESLEATALHEVLHIFLASLIHTCYAEGETTTLVDEIEHGVIIVLESVLMSTLSEQKGHFHVQQAALQSSRQPAKGRRRQCRPQRG